MVLLALRGIAVGATVQTTFVTGLSVIPLKNVARGSSLINATRQVVQAVGVALLATILVGSLSPQIANLQQQFLNQPIQHGAAPVAICAPQITAISGAASAAPQVPGDPASLLAEACKENVAGFEQAYKVTFYAAILALILGLLLPGWPLKWAGRRAADAPPTPISH
jgi:DHA2 family multidrug resistance protein